MFANYLRGLRESTGMDQEAFAAHLSYSRTYISALENALRSPSLTFLARLRKLYGMSVDALIDSWETP